MTEEEARAKALECALAAFQSLPEERKKRVVENADAQGIDLHQQILNTADVFLAYIKP